MNHDTMTMLKVGDKMDVFYIQTNDPENNYWYIATVIDLNEEQVKIHYDCDDDKYSDDTWIQKTSNRLAKLHTHTIPRMRLPKPPIAGSSTPATFYSDNDKQYILLYIHKIHTIYRYDIMEQKWINYCNYPTDFNDCNDFNDISLCFDDDNKEIHTMGVVDEYEYGHCLRYIYTKFDITTCQWTKIRKNDVTAAVIPFYLGFLSKDINELHVFWKKYHQQVVKHRVNTNSFQLAQPGTFTDDFGVTVYDITWNEQYQILAIKDEKDDLSIHSYTITKDKSMAYKWKLSPPLMQLINMNQTHYSCKLVLGFHHILFVFTSPSDIWCIDLLNGGYYKSLKKTGFIYDQLSIVKTDDNFVHLIHCGWRMNDRIWLGHIIPNELNKVYLDKIYNPLVFGYIANITKQYKIYNTISSDVIHIILAYIPPFL